MNLYATLSVALFICGGVVRGERALKKHSEVEERQVGLFYGLGSSFRMSSVMSLIPRRVRMMASCVMQVGNSSDMREMRDEAEYMTNLLQQNGATGPVIFEMEMIYSDTAQAIMAVPNILMKPTSELSLDDALSLRDAAFHIMALPIRIQTLQTSIQTMFFHPELYSPELLADMAQHSLVQVSLASRMGSEILACRNAGSDEATSQLPTLPTTTAQTEQNSATEKSTAQTEGGTLS